MEPVFRTLEIAVSAATRAIGTRITYHGLEHIPEHGGAVIAINHTSYVDWSLRRSRLINGTAGCGS